MIVVSNTTPLIGLASIQRFSLLQQIFSKIYFCLSFGLTWNCCVSRISASVKVLLMQFCSKPKNELRNTANLRGVSQMNLMRFGAIGIILLLIGCQNILPEKPSDRRAFDPNDNISFPHQPRWLQLFHTNPEANFGNHPLILTWYSRPYSGSFDVFFFLEDGSVQMFVESPEWARQGGISPTRLNIDERQRINKILEVLPQAEIPVRGNDATIIVMSFETSKDKRQTITCTESECPSEIQELFKIAYNAFKRDTQGLYLSIPFDDDPQN